MGLFVLDLAKKKSTKTRVQTAIHNLELWKREGCRDDHEHLLIIAQTYIDDALELIEKKNKKKKEP